ncbi:hypothetical protein [Streptomyces sp. enrichment culture]|uniref:hypothetical protein n=1 Tax=Streptomyces sp. enrichment culture TaxID=1795815 RepID=UPI003F56B478
MRKQLRAGAVAGLSVALSGAMLALPAQAVAAGKAKSTTATVKFDCKIHEVSDRFGTAQHRGCKKDGKYQVSLRTKDTKWDGWDSNASVKRGGVTILNVGSRDGKGSWSAWKSTKWSADKGPYVVSA